MIRRALSPILHLLHWLDFRCSPDAHRYAEAQRKRAAVAREMRR